MIKHLLVVILLVMVFTYAEEKGKSENAEFKTVTVKKFTFSFKVEGDNLIAKVSCPTKGWVAIGFNPTRKMKGANFIIGCNRDGEEIIEDHFGVSPIKHKADTLIGGENNLIESSCADEDGKTTLSFTIPLNSGDEKDGVLKQGEENKVIFAAGKKDNLKTKHFTLAKTNVVF